MNAVKLKILQTLGKEYLIPLRHQTLIYANVTPFEMIMYLNDTYGEIANKDSIQLKIQLSEQYDTATTLND